MDHSIPILYEDRHVLIVNKPAGLVCHEDANHGHSVRSILADKLAKERGRPSAFLTPAHRLDRGTSGAMVLGKTSKALSRLTKSLGDKKETKKIYHFLAIAFKEDVECLRKSPTLWKDYLIKKEHYSQVHTSRQKLSKEALSYAALLEEKESFVEALNFLGSVPTVLKPLLKALLEETVLVKVQVELETGRYHQIRVQAASRGFWILGDWRYLFLYLRKKKQWVKAKKKITQPQFFKMLSSLLESDDPNGIEQWHQLLQQDSQTELSCSQPFYLHSKEIELARPVQAGSTEDEKEKISIDAAYPKNMPLWQQI